MEIILDETGTIIEEANNISGKVFIKEGVEHIADKVFHLCKNMTELILPKSLKSIGEYSFSHCIKIKIIHFSKALILIENNAFYGCIGLESVMFSEGGAEELEI